MDRDNRHDPVIKSALIEPLDREHVCGLMGYNGMIDPPCPGCEDRTASFERQRLLRPAQSLIGTPLSYVKKGGPQQEEVIQKFDTGAVRDLDSTKYDYEAFLSPLVIEGYAAYMHKNRKLKDGSVRDGDNWQKGIPLKNYAKSGWRHFFAFWKAHRSGKPFTDQQIEETYAILFNISGYLHEIEKKKQGL